MTEQDCYQRCYRVNDYLFSLYFLCLLVEQSAGVIYEFVSAECWYLCMKEVLESACDFELETISSWKQGTATTLLLVIGFQTSVIVLTINSVLYSIVTHCNHHVGWEVSKVL